jgi:DNA-binding NtrC family response regulator
LPPLIYLFEDDASLRALLTELIREELGGDVEPCSTIGALRERCAARRPDLIVADFWGASHLRLDESERSEIGELGAIAPVILVSARAWAVGIASTDLGIVALVPKPLDMETFVDVLHSALSQTTAREDAQQSAVEQATDLPPRESLSVFILGWP